MSQINPFIGSVLQTPQALRQQAAEKASQIRGAQDRAKNAGLFGTDTFEHQVESGEARDAISDDDGGAGQQQYQPNDQQHEQTDPENPENEPLPRLDLTA